MNVLILSTRIFGTDGVSLECLNWQKMLTQMGHTVTLLAGKLDRQGFVIPELYFQSPKVVRLHDNIVYGKNKFKEVESQVFEQSGRIEGQLRQFFNTNGIPDLLITSNTLSLPVHFPLAVALTRVIHELNIKTIARHHDFWWERERFLNSELFSFFERWFPPNLPNIHHVVINSLAQDELLKRTGIHADIIYDTLDFSDVPKKDAYSEHFRKDFGIASDDIVFLQATRIVPRKRIELSIELMEKLHNPKAVLVIAGYAGDEAGNYLKRLKVIAKASRARVLFIGKWVNGQRRIIELERNEKKSPKRRIYTLWDCYLNADFVTYPTELEGFGNQFVEAVKFKKPVILTEYSVYKSDIAPLGFKVVSMPDKVTEKVVKEVNRLMENKAEQLKMVEHNFALGQKYLSFEWAKARITNLLTKIKTGL